MAVKVKVTSRKFFNGLTNDSDFLTSPATFTNHLSANVGERVRYEAEVRVEYWYEFQENYYIENGDTIRIESGNFFDEGFSTGDVVHLIAANGTDYFFKTIGNLTPDEMTFTVGGLADGLYNFANDGVVGAEPLNSLVYKFGLLEQDESFNDISKIDQISQQYIVQSMPIGVPQVGEWKNSVKTGQLGTFTATKTGEASSTRLGVTTLDAVQLFTVQHDFIVTPYYLDGEIDNLVELILPELYEGSNTIRYEPEMEFRSSFSNPNSAKTIRDQYEVLGSVGYYNENFNGFINKYSVGPVTYFDQTNGLNSTAIIPGVDNKISFTLTAVDPVFATLAAPFGVQVSKLPSLSEYTENTDNFTDNFIYAYARSTVGGSGGSDFISNLLGSYVDDFTIDISFDVNYSAAQQLKINDEQDDTDNYLIAVNIEDPLLAGTLSDRVMLKVDVRDYLSNADIPDLAVFGDFAITAHPDDIGGTTFTDAKGWIEDGLSVLCPFSLDLSKSAVLESLSFDLIIRNPLTEDETVLQSVPISLDDQFIVDDEQIITLDTTRGFRLPTGDQFNLLQLTTGTRLGDFMPYALRVGVKISWQKWIALIVSQGVQDAFFDPNEPSNGLSLDASRYSLANDYSVKFRVSASISQDGVSTPYEHLSPDILVYDYDLEDDVPAEWDTNIELYNQSGTLLIDKRLGDEDTDIKSTFIPNTITLPDPAEYLIIHRTEEIDNFGDDITEISSIRGFNPAYELKPIDASGNLKITQDINDLVGESTFDASKADPNKSYRISARLMKKDLQEAPSLIIRTNREPIGDGAFAVNITNPSEVGTFIFEDGSQITANSISTSANGLDGNIQIVKYTVPSGDFSNVDAISIFDANIVEIQDFSQLTDCTVFNIQDNPLLQDVLWPVSTVNIATINSQNNIGLTSQDFTNLGGFGGSIDYTDCNNLTSVTFGPSTHVSTSLNFTDCDINGVDFSTFLGVGGLIRFPDNNNLQTFIAGNQTNAITQLNMLDCDYQGVFDISTWDDFKGGLILQGNNNLTGLIISALGSGQTDINLNSCDLQGTLDLSYATDRLKEKFLASTQVSDSLDTVIFPSNSINIAQVAIQGSGLSLPLDLSPLTNTSGIIDLRNNNNSAITIPSTAGVFTQIRLGNNNYTYVDFTPLTGVNDGVNINVSENNPTAANVDQMLIDIDAKGWINGTFVNTLNPVATATSAAARANLILNGWTLTGV